jgi:hypothetical protein
MWNNKKYAAMAVLGVSLAVAAATPASAQWLDGAYGYAGGCGGYGYAPAYGYAGGCGYGAYGAAYGSGYAGVYSYGWPYGIIGDYGYAPAYGYAGGCGGAYGYAPIYGYGGGCGGYGAYGYAGGCGGYGGYGYGASYGYAPVYGYAGGCRAHRHYGHGGYALARITPRHQPDAYAASAPRYHHRQLYASAHSPQYGSNYSIGSHLVSAK